MKNLEILSKIALIITQKTSFNKQINAILEIIGNYVNVSRAYIFFDSEDGLYTRNTFEWCNDNIKPQIQSLQHVTYDSIPSWHKILEKEGMIKSSDIKKLPEDIINFLEYQDILSIVVFPLKISDDIHGFIGFDECTRKREWYIDELKILETLSNIISNVYEKHHVLNEIKRFKNDFEYFFNTIEDFFLITDLSGKILFSNDYLREELGYNKLELSSMNIADLFSDNFKEEVNNLYMGVKSYSIDNHSLELRSKNETLIPIYMRNWLGEWNSQDCMMSVSKNLSKEQELLRKFTKIFQSNPAAMSLITLKDEIFVDINQKFIEKLGYTRDDIIGKSLKEVNLLVNTDKKEMIRANFLKTGFMKELELQVLCKNNDVLDGLISGELIENEGENYALIVMVDITKQKKLQNLYNSERKRLHSIIEGTRLGTWEWNIQTGETIFNEKWAEIIGYNLKELEPTNIDTWEKFAHPEDLVTSTEELNKHFRGEIDFYDINCRMRHKDGRWIWVNDRGKVIEWDDNGKPLMMYGTHVDITEKKEIEDKIKEISIRDPLTEVYNRRYIYDRLDKVLSRSKREETIFSVAILDIDRFKRINDSYGHIVGDFILKEFTKTIAENLREYDLLGRYGGEEFIILMHDTDKVRAEIVIMRILEIVRSKIFKYDNYNISFTFSAGISDITEFDIKAVTNEEIIMLADERLYIAKDAGRNRIGI